LDVLGSDAASPSVPHRVSRGLSTTTAVSKRHGKV
jgi:hypothetical protein